MMKISIYRPIGFSFKGIRESNEDAIFPEANNGSADDRYLIVCDGVGGSDKGEVASQLACESFVSYFESNKRAEVNQDFLSKGLQYVEASFDEYFLLNPQVKGMGTTIAMVYLHEKGVEVAWCGDTRVYHIRKDQIIFRTEDHSFINEMLRFGTLSEEQARKHPNRNVITRAIQGASIKATALDAHRITNIQANDYLIICTDGVWEPVTDNMLIGILSGRDNNSQKLGLIAQECQQSSKDNYSCYLIQIQDVDPTE